MDLSALLKMLIVYTTNSKRESRERLAKYLDDIAWNAAALAEAWRDILDDYDGELDPEKTRPNYYCTQMFIVEQMRAIEESHEEVLGKHADTFRDLTASLRRIIKARDVAKANVEHLASETCSVLFLENRYGENDSFDKLHKLTDAIQKEAAQIQVIATNFRASK